MKSLNMLFAEQKSLKEQQQKLDDEYRKNKKVLTEKIERNKNLISSFNNMNDKSAFGKQLIENISGSSYVVLQMINLLKSEIQKGNLSKIAKNFENIKYCYDYGFHSGNAYVLEVNKSVKYSSIWGEIRFTNDFYNHPVTDDVINFILSYLNLITKEATSYTLNIPENSVFSIVDSNNEKFYYQLIKDNHDNFILQSIRNLKEIPATNWDIQRRFKLVLNANEYTKLKKNFDFDEYLDYTSEHNKSDFFCFKNYLNGYMIFEK
jgi:hypothetical protein